MTASASAAGRRLAHLGLEREDPGLEYLHRLVHRHQVRVPFETLTKLIDYEPGLRRGDFMPAFDGCLDRIVTRGGGGLCWTLARGFHALLADLGFDASLMLMEPGHCCVRVELPEGPHDADVGDAAPIFRAYPLFESFTLETSTGDRRGRAAAPRGPLRCRSVALSRGGRSPPPLLLGGSLRVGRMSGVAFPPTALPMR